ncbi:SH3 domain-containing protein [Leeuwenhoekiella marinoflava]|uniref:SH3 domain-containing protein n=1 Tax=Leeuwenhoekiella marinoflava TaxID=988 RepID=UPI003AB9995B
MRLWVVSPVLNLREAPTSSSRILRKLKENQEVEVLEVSGPWLKIKVKIDDVTGYVYSSYLKSKDR